MQCNALAVGSHSDKITIRDCNALANLREITVQFVILPAEEEPELTYPEPNDPEPNDPEQGPESVQLFLPTMKR